jgi:hypothetical protein
MRGPPRNDRTNYSRPMHLIYVSNGLDGAHYHALSEFVSFVVMVGGFLAFVVCLWALTVRNTFGALTERIRQLELAAHSHAVPLPPSEPPT